jgi:uncharacterized protein with PIN domain
MKCPKCGASVMDVPFQRVKPKGDSVEPFWCENCVKKYYPELYKNNIEDEWIVVKDLKKIFYK